MGLFADAGVLRIWDNKKDGFQKIGFGWENWKTNKNSPSYYFAVAGRNPVPSKIAATGTWLNDNTLQINFKFVDAVHGDKLTFVFDENKVTLSLLHSVAENSKGTEDKREKMVATMV